MRLKAALLTSTLLVMRVSLAADPEPYTVHLPATGNAAPRRVIRRRSQRYYYKSEKWVQ